MVADTKMVEYHGQPQVESYVLTIMNMVSLRGARGTVLEAQDGRPAGPRVRAGGAASGLWSPGRPGRCRAPPGESGAHAGPLGGLLRRAGGVEAAGVTAAVRDDLGSLRSRWSKQTFPLCAAIPGRWGRGHTQSGRPLPATPAFVSVRRVCPVLESASC